MKAARSGDGLRTGEVVGVADVFGPVDHFAVECLGDGDVGHGCRRRRAMPMTMAGRAPDDVADVEFDDGAAFALRPAFSGSHDEDLAERMRMPRAARAGLEGDRRPTHARVPA